MPWKVETENVSVGDAHRVLLESKAPEPIKQYIRGAIGDLVATHGDDVGVSFRAEGRDRDSGAAALIEVQGYAAPAKEYQTESAPTVEEQIDRHYRHNRSDHLVEALKRIAGRNQA